MKRIFLGRLVCRPTLLSSTGQEILLFFCGRGLLTDNAGIPRIMRQDSASRQSKLRDEAILNMIVVHNRMYETKCGTVCHGNFQDALVKFLTALWKSVRYIQQLGVVPYENLEAEDVLSDGVGWCGQAVGSTTASCLHSTGRLSSVLDSLSSNQSRLFEKHHPHEVRAVVLPKNPMCRHCLLPENQTCHYEQRSEKFWAKAASLANSPI